MYISRAQSRTFAVLAGLLFIAGAVASTLFSSGREKLPTTSLSQDRVEDIQVTNLTESAEKPKPASDDSSRFMLNNFQRSEVKNGRKVWEIIAPAGQYHPEKQSATVQQPVLVLFKDDGKKIELRAKQAELKFEGAGLAWAKALGAVHINYADEILIDSESAIYDKTNNLVTSDELVNIKTERLLISGKSLRANLETQQIDLKINVKTKILPLNKRKK